MGLIRLMGLIRPQLLKVSIFFLVSIFSVVAYSQYFKNGWYVQDDYITLSIGGHGSVIETAGRIINWVYDGQGRYQPVRLFLFSAVAHLAGEEFAPYYNFVMHLTNLALLIVLLRKFQVSYSQTIFTVLLFSVFGRYRMMEAPTAMIVGSGLNLFFMLSTIILLLYFLTESQFFRKMVLYIGSLASFAGLTFSYEIAFPVFVAIACSYLIYTGLRFTKEKLLRDAATLMPYLLILIFYFINFRTQQSNYTGASIKISVDIISRTIAYTNYVFLYPLRLHFNSIIIGEIAIYIIILIALRSLRAETPKPVNDSQMQTKLLLLGASFYFSTAILFVLNQWQTPTSVMVHHVYPMTAASSIFIVAFLYGVGHLLGPRFENIYQRCLTVFVIPFLLLSGVWNNLENYKAQATNSNEIKALKAKLWDAANSKSIDAILIKNLPDGDLGVSSFDGAFLQWNRFTRHVQSGDKIIKLSNHQATFLGPLTYYHKPNKKYVVDDKSLHIYDYRAGNFPASPTNIFKIDHSQEIEKIFGRQVSCDKNIYSNFVLKNNDYNGIKIDAQGRDAALDLMRKSSIRLNGNPVSEYELGQNDIIIPLDNSEAKYIFMEIQTDAPILGTRFSIQLVKSWQSGSKIKMEATQPLSYTGEESNLLEAQLDWKKGFYGEERATDRYWRWAEPDSLLEIVNPNSVPIHITLKMGLASAFGGKLRLNSSQFDEEFPTDTNLREFHRDMQLNPGSNIVSFKSTAPKTTGANDPRNLSLQVLNYSVANCNSTF